MLNESDREVKGGRKMVRRSGGEGKWEKRWNLMARKFEEEGGGERWERIARRRRQKRT